MAPSEDNRAGFAPTNIYDDRIPGHWETRYPPEARRAITYEAIYLGVLFIVIIGSIITVSCNLLNINLICITENTKYILGWLGGTFGGLLFAIKWLYHSVAKNIWNIDRRLWRIFTPHLSGALAFIMIILIASDFFNIFDVNSLNKNSTVLGLGFIVGYFSDNAIAKLTEVANTLLGPTEKHSNSSAEKSPTNDNR